MFITVTRTHKVVTPASDSRFGNLMADLCPFKCVSLENGATLIPANVVYDVQFMWSNDFGQIMPHVIVPVRTAIEIHWANYVVDPANAQHIELKGCTALGSAEELAADCIDESKDAWVAFVQQVLTDQPAIKIIYKEDYGPVTV